MTVVVFGILRVKNHKFYCAVFLVGRGRGGRLVLHFHSSREGTFLSKKVMLFFLFLYENICCGYSLEAPH